MNFATKNFKQSHLEMHIHLMALKVSQIYTYLPKKSMECGNVEMLSYSGRFLIHFAELQEM